MHRLTNRGFSHLLVPVLAFLIVAGLGGAYFLAKSHAATTTNTTSSNTSNTSSTSTTENGTVPEPTGGGPDATDMATLAANAKAFIAAQAQIKNSSGGPKFCLYYDNHLCMVTHGGNSLTISSDSNAWAQWSWFAYGDTLEFQNFAGNCLRNNSDRTITMENHGCDGEDGERWYVLTNQAPYHFKSYKFYNNNWFLATYGNVNGWKVWDILYGTKNYWRSWGLYN